MDEKTLEAARRGDPDALGALLRQLQDSWYRMSFSLLGNADLAEDAVQETGIRFIRRLPGFRGESQLRTWSLGICLNVAREIRRWAAGKRATTSDCDAGDSPDPALGPYASAMQSESIRSVRQMLSLLPDRQREALVLRFFEEMSAEQTAHVMGCAAGTVKATVHQALRALRRKLEPSGRA